MDIFPTKTEKGRETNHTTRQHSHCTAHSCPLTEKGWSQQKDHVVERVHWSMSLRRVGLDTHQAHRKAGVEEQRAETGCVLASILQKTTLAVQKELLLI